MPAGWTEVGLLPGDTAEAQGQRCLQQVRGGWCGQVTSPRRRPRGRSHRRARGVVDGSASVSLRGGRGPGTDLVPSGWAMDVGIRQRRRHLVSLKWSWPRIAGALRLGLSRSRQRRQAGGQFAVRARAAAACCLLPFCPGLVRAAGAGPVLDSVRLCPAGRRRAGEPDPRAGDLGAFVMHSCGGRGGGPGSLSSLCGPALLRCCVAACGAHPSPSCLRGRSLMQHVISRVLKGGVVFAALTQVKEVRYRC